MANGRLNVFSVCLFSIISGSYLFCGTISLFDTTVGHRGHNIFGIEVGTMTYSARAPIKTNSASFDGPHLFLISLALFYSPHGETSYIDKHNLPFGGQIIVLVVTLYRSYL
jgi:hypothetical protein